ncbi:MAG: hypothetical protein KA716_31915 [Gloeotrichia echinulata DEX184]|nr:hypothetical protein [Gloeotrichia echinulata DEX184]MCM0594543.1 hypothetical protein [Gloeotrichia echinulata DEX184]
MEQLSLFSLPITSRDTLLIPRQWQKSHLGYLGKFEIIFHLNRKKGIEYTIEYSVLLDDHELATAEIITSLISAAEADFRATVEKLVNNHHAIATDDLTDSGHFTECVRPQQITEEFADEHHEPDNSQSVRPQQMEEFADEHYEPENSESVRPQQEHTHWVQDYWVKRGNKKHHYYRYCWMVGRRKYCLHIGNTSLPSAKEKKQEVECAIAQGRSPDEIKKIIKSYNSNSVTNF